jgi:acyl-CoA oxidase
MLGALVQGRVSLDGAATTGTALALHRPHLREPAPPVRLGLGQRRGRAARLRQAPAAPAASPGAELRAVLRQRRVAAQVRRRVLGSHRHPAGAEDLETLAAALKPLSTWNALSTIQEAREACGGSGFLAENRMVGLHQDLDVYVTFEGDNNILLQLVGKRLLADYAKQFKGADAAKLASFAAKQTAGKVFHGAGLRDSVRRSPTSARRRARSSWGCAPSSSTSCSRVASSR